MSNQLENEKQQFQTVPMQEVRQSLLAELDASRQAIEELSDEQLETIAGGFDDHFEHDHFEHVHAVFHGFGHTFLSASPSGGNFNLGIGLGGPNQGTPNQNKQG